ncbi:MAG: serine/threonine-protein kinase [Planctomycetaceae bacterium]
MVQPRPAAAQAPPFDLLALAGRGTFAEVWLAQERNSGCLVALKLPRDDAPNVQLAKTLIENEGEVTGKVDSEHVVRLIEAPSRGRNPHLVLEWLSGETLEARLRRQTPLPIGETLWIARQTAQGLADLLAAGYSHGDLKPANVFVCRNGLVKLIDLGFARPDKRPVPDALFAERVVLGTPEYLAPESFAPGDRPGVARDLYALGVTLYRMLTGVAPFQGETAAEIARLQQQLHPPRVRSVAPFVSAEVEDLVHRLLSKQPLRRGENLSRLVSELVGLELSSLSGPGD